MPTIIHRPTSRIRPECNWLSAYAHDVASQNGQDGVIEKIFEIIEPTSRLCVEFGGYDGKAMSNTWRLIVEDGWSGVFIEPDRENFDKIAVNHPNGGVRKIHQSIMWTGEDSFDRTMRREKVPSDIDFLSMDIDGNEWHVWDAIEDYRPKVVSVEFNPSVPNDVYFVQDPDVAVNQGSSLLAFIELGKRKGYALVSVVGMDAFFVLDQYYERFGILDNHIDCMFDPSRTLLFQGYDGTLFTAGMRLLAWRGIPFDYDQLQVLPEGERVFGARR